MSYEFTNKPRDMQWLRCTHLRKGNVRMADGKINLAGSITGFKSAAIHGNDDSPDRIDVYVSDDPLYSDFCMTFVLDSDGLYRELAREAK